MTSRAMFGGHCPFGTEHQTSSVHAGDCRNVAEGVVPTPLLLSGFACLNRKPGSWVPSSSPLLDGTTWCVVTA